MHIPSYQIRNVLNVYRKQLSQGPGRAPKASPLTTSQARDRINISSDGQRQSIMDRISSEIADRLAQFGPETNFDSVLEGKLTQPIPERESARSQEDAEFSYTVIDEHNRKLTNTLPIRTLGPQAPKSGPAARPEMEDIATLEKK